MSAGGEKTVVFSHRAMACDWQVQIVGLDPAEAEHAAHEAFERIDALEAELSRFIETSDVARLNRTAAGQWLRVGPAMIAVLEVAERVRAASGGAFDVCAAAGRSVAGRIEIDAERQRVRRLDAQVRVDLGGVGKGYALDEAGEVLADWGVEAALLHCGQSTVLAVGDAGRSWEVAIRDPDDPQRTIATETLRGGEALSGSGVTLRPHIVDPRSGRAETRWPAAWALAATAAEADAWSTALMLMDAEAIRSACGRSGLIRAMWVEKGAGVRAQG